MIQIIFQVVAKSLIYISKKTGFTYYEVNVLVYYFGVPFSWLALLDIYFQFHFLKGAFVVSAFGFWLGCTDFKSYSDQLFRKSVSFLNYFNRWGSNYIASSVLICVFLPIVIYYVLIALVCG